MLSAAEVTAKIELSVCKICPPKLIDKGIPPLCSAYVQIEK
jgi:hypothetical protein